jgi:hypothetical protein
MARQADRTVGNLAELVDVPLQIDADRYNGRKQVRPGSGRWRATSPSRYEAAMPSGLSGISASSSEVA